MPSCAGASRPSRTSRSCRPDTGIVHQVNLEYLARVVFTDPSGQDGAAALPQAYPDTLVGTNSHTTMINGLGVLGWGVGGIEAEAAMLGQPVSMLIPQVVGFRLTGALREGVDRDRPGADRHRDAAHQGRRRQVCRVLRPRPARAAHRRPRDDRQHGARIRRDLRHLPRRRRDAALPAPHRALRGAGRAGRGVHARSRACSTPPTSPEAALLGHAGAGPEHGRAEHGRAEAPAGSRAAGRRQAVVPGRAAGDPQPRRPRRTRPSRSSAGKARAATRRRPAASRRSRRPRRCGCSWRAASICLDHGSVVIAAITSCTNTSNPSVMVRRGAAGEKGGRARAGNASPGSRPRWRPAPRSSPTTWTRPG